MDKYLMQVIGIMFTFYSLNMYCVSFLAVFSSYTNNSQHIAIASG